MKWGLFLCLSLFAKSALACEPQINLKDQAFAPVAEIVKALVQTNFTVLCSDKIDIEGFRSEDVLLRANFDFMKFVFTGRRGNYRVQVNRKLPEMNIPVDGLEAILAHELVHIADYVKMNNSELRTFGRKYLADSNFRRDYERATDQSALDLNYREGLFAFRCWQRSFLNERQWRKKMQSGYFSPEEILPGRSCP